MRKLIVSNMMSLDGYSAGPGEDTGVLPMDEAFDAYNAELLRAADTLLVGRATYDMFRGFWPSVADDPDTTPTEQEVSRLIDAIDKVVVSDSITPEQTEPWRDTTRIVGRTDAHERIAELKRQTGEDVLVFGSRALWNDLISNDLVEELHLMVGQVILGSGTPIFVRNPEVLLRLLGTRTWDGSGNVLLQYEVQRRGT
jgi:dihydrofolate reductase